ncbi:polar residue rich protein-d12.4 [Ichnoviriform fugitivi]|uniref:Polar residue rich protein-d12.4 n=1 Tax=Ichnoviriform fugitivi TaxID=265522 RepID=A2Q0N5_9VIRU|nr:polar residue rich protein-d12.4 [Ichnoviriform fugitivi]BAF45750.1 polar residue rich protein-d12.4 [Ichnoviriform fugitivi]
MLKWVPSNDAKRDCGQKRAREDDEAKRERERKEEEMKKERLKREEKIMAEVLLKAEFDRWDQHLRSLQDPKRRKSKSPFGLRIGSPM